MGEAKLARRVERMGTQVNFVPMQAVEGRDFGGGGDGWSPSAKHVEGQLSGRQEEVPQVRGECEVGGGEAGNEVVLRRTYSTFGSEGAVLAGDGICDGDVDFREGEKVK